MRILKAISDSATNEIESNGFMLRVKRVRSSDLAEVGVAALAMVPTLDGKASKKKNAAQNITPDQAKKLAKYQEAVCCAALVAIGDPSNGEWNDVKMVMDEKREDPAAGVLWIGSLPSGIVSSCFQESMRLSTDEGDAAELLGRFRRPA